MCNCGLNGASKIVGLESGNVPNWTGVNNKDGHCRETKLKKLKN